MTDSLGMFMPEVADWFEEAFQAPTEVQTLAWSRITGGHDTLVAAPTGSGKTLAAFLWALNSLARQAQDGSLREGCQVLYVSPLRALSNDISRNLQAPLEAIQERLGIFAAPIKASVRTGDTPALERERMRRHPPHILVTTPESLYLLLTSDSGRRLLAPTHTVIVDELHALAENKRGAHLLVSLERLAKLTGRSVQRIGLSATQKPVEKMARLLAGVGRPLPQVVDLGHRRRLDLSLCLPQTSLMAVMPIAVWEEVCDQLVALSQTERTTLVFVNTRRLAERVGRWLSERVGGQLVAVHHGSLAREDRERAEQQLKNGDLRILVATASLELGVDIGDVDLVCQLGSPHSIAAFLQRVGRSGHRVGQTPKGRLFPLSRDDLTECVALLSAVADGALEPIEPCEGPFDVLSQHLVAEVAAQDCSPAELYSTFRRAWPYRNLKREAFDALVEMQALGFTSRRGRRLAHIHYDRVAGILKARRGARRFALENGGVIPDQFDYEVRLNPESLYIGTVNEDFAFESSVGDIFQLGNRSYRVIKVEDGTVRVDDARGAPPTIPFWIGEAPGRSGLLSEYLCRLYREVEEALTKGTKADAAKAINHIPGMNIRATEQLLDYLETAWHALGALPDSNRLILERFFDEVGDQHLVIHSPRGIRLNRAMGLALRKRFCRRFNFELQAAANDNALVLSLGATHSFALKEVVHYVNSKRARQILTQAVLQAPMFPVRWRWICSTALALTKRRHGKRLPAIWQRANAEDLIALIFPEQLACQDNVVGERTIPEHPLVDQTMGECLDQLLDTSGYVQLLEKLTVGELDVVTEDLPEPSPLAREITLARAWAFLDDGAAEERRTRAIGPEKLDIWTRHMPPIGIADLRQLREEVWPPMKDEESLADALVVMGFVTATEGGKHNADGAMSELERTGRAVRVTEPCLTEELWVAAERVGEVQHLLEQASESELPHEGTKACNEIDPQKLLAGLLRSRLEGLGAESARQLTAPLGISTRTAEAALTHLEQQGIVMQLSNVAEELGSLWADRHWAMRLARRRLKPVGSRHPPLTVDAYQRFLLAWHGMGVSRSGPDVLRDVIHRLSGCCLPACLWESLVFPARIQNYQPGWLDALSSSGECVWTCSPSRGSGTRQRSFRSTPIRWLPRRDLPLWLRLAGPPSPLEGSDELSVFEVLKQRGALFWDDLLRESRLLGSHLEGVVEALIRKGWLTCDSPNAVRSLVLPPRRRGRDALANAGRISLLPHVSAHVDEPLAEADKLLVARILLQRYGVVFRSLTRREPTLPPWRELCRMFWRLEAQGEVMSGRFVEEVAGEQFALPDALGLLQRCRRTADSQISLLAPSDPVVLSNLLFPDTKIPTHSGNRVLFRGGNPVAALVRGTYQPLADATSEERAYFERCLNEASPKLQAYGRRPRDSKRRQLHAAQLIGG